MEDLNLAAIPTPPPSPPPYTLQREQGRIFTIIDYCLSSTDQFQRVKSCNVIPKHVHNLTTDHNPSNSTPPA